ncbi:MAG: nickel pincer cofactor biosynthesis protein LarC [Planctomycetota bacterium]
MLIGYLDCFSGVSGDMWVGALLDAGLDLGRLQPAVASLGLPGVEIAARPVRRSGLAGTKFDVTVPDAGASPVHRHLRDVRAIVRRGDLPPDVRERAEAVFEALAAVEARAHAASIDEVHFHEVGAEDTIVDVVCACLGLAELGVQRLYASAVTVGGGTVECAHGTLPVPAPGALGNLIGVPIRSGGPPGEAVTPTGAALLKVLVAEFEPALRWTPRAVGYGAGTRDVPGFPNLVRLALGDARPPGATGSATALWQLDCHVDTATGEDLGHLLGELLRRGATDAFATAIHMKKGRPGQLLTVLVDDARRLGITELLLEESTSLGVRAHAVARDVLERWSEEHQTPLGRVRYKACRLPSGAVLRRPEDDELTRLAREHGRSRREIRAELSR